MFVIIMANTIGVQTINGEATWLNDSDGNKIPASGTDAITPPIESRL